LKSLIRNSAKKILQNRYGQDVPDEQILINSTPPEYEGDFTIVVFPFAKIAKQNPEALAKEIGEQLKNSVKEIEKYNVVKGFLNITLKEDVWINFLNENAGNENLSHFASNGRSVIVEYCSPNTNKPLHLGHLRNIALGYSLAEIFEAAGYGVVKTIIVNDRGIHICKSMLAYQKFGNGETPQSTGIKGDHFVGNFYVQFEQEYQKQIKELIATGVSEGDAKKKAPLMLEVQQMLVDWENHKPDVIELWKRMNDWVLTGFNESYKRIGCDFDKTYFESDTYVLGKKIVEQGLQKNVFFKKPDGSVWIDLTADGMDQKVLLRADGTAVYITQDLGTAQLRYEDFHCEKSVYVVGSEQEYHFKVLKLVLQKLKEPYADGIYHLSYGMVDLPSGKMKSREGTVVDADDLITEMEKTAEDYSRASGKIEGYSADEERKLFNMLALGALKFYLLRVDPKKKILFNPQESIDFHGHTGTFIQYTYARIQSVLHKFPEKNISPGKINYTTLHPTERNIILQLFAFTETISEAAETYNPAVLADYVYQLARSFNTFYGELSILSAESNDALLFRINLSKLTASVIHKGMKLLGMDVPDRM
jgi:arginyl-tRNA synthetase